MEIVFNEPLMLILLLLLPILVVMHYYFFEHNKKRAMRFANFSALKRVTGTRLITKNTTQLILRLFVLGFFILAASQPVFWYNSEVSLTDYVIAIDASASMVNEDVLPNRLTVAKQAASAFLDSLDTRTKVGVVSFAGVSFIKLPLTSEMFEVRQAINNIDVELSGGTDIGAALINSVNLLSNSETRSIILITDGSDTSGVFVEESIETSLNYVVNNQVTVHTIAIGSGLANVGYLEGIDLPAVFDQNTLKIISDRTGGNSYEVKSTSEIALAFDDIERLSEEGRVSYDSTNLLYALALILLLLEWVLLNTLFRALP